VLDTFECILTKLDVREFSSENVPLEIKMKILEAARARALTNPNYNFHMIDAGRVVQDMQLAAWNFGVVSCLFTGINVENLRRDFSVPEQMQPSIVVGFGYPAKKILGKKNRLPLDEIAFLEKYDTKLDSQKL